jgi:mono/diheme cytochrome c family protein
MPIRRLCPAVVVFAAVVGRSPAADPAFTPEQVRFYEAEVKPLLKKHCLRCHGADEKKLKGGLRLTTRAGVLAGGDSGPAVSLDNPDGSLLLLAVRNKRPDGGEVMPPSGQLPDAELAVLTKWVREKLPVSPADLGAAAAAAEGGGLVTDEAKRYWAYQPVQRPAQPGAGHPIDAFLDARLRAKGLTPVGPADRATLVRRAYYDLLGLPPTPEEIDRFVRDPSPDAWPRLIDHLLASPHYGEKWGRHWLDVVRYAETNGYERDGPKPFAWRYRDYVIRSFNEDKPYDRFVREQLAGDELPWSADAVTATGFYRLGLWDDEPADAEQALFDGYDDYVTVVGQGMLGMTLNCARCHDHKKDPIRHADYYRFLAFFRDVRPYSASRDVGSSANMTDLTPPGGRPADEGDRRAREEERDRLTAAMTAVEDAAIRRMPAEDQRAAEGTDRPRVVAKLAGVFTADEKREYARLKRRRDDLQRQPRSGEYALSVNRCDPRPPATHVLARGNPYAKKEAVEPGFPLVLGFPEPVIPPPGRDAKSSGRRKALADWVADPRNPLTARVMANRVWQHHFGKGIVPTPNDFGKLGEPPTHPELLDWLASEFVATGWRLKPLHRLLMTSAAYQRASAADANNLVADPANNLLWRFNARRLTAEEVRDSMLLAGGRLDPSMFGPSAFPKIPREVLAGQSVPGDGWVKGKARADLGYPGYDPQQPDAGNRRSVYVHVKRSLQVPVLIAHDQADTDNSCPVRYTTTVPTQALGMLNGEFAHESAAALARRLERECPGDLSAQVARAVRLTTGRVPAPAEVTADVRFVERMRAEHRLDAGTALARYALLALNANEFVYLD